MQRSLWVPHIVNKHTPAIQLNLIVCDVPESLTHVLSCLSQRWSLAACRRSSEIACTLRSRSTGCSSSSVTTNNSPERQSRSHLAMASQPMASQSSMTTSAAIWTVTPPMAANQTRRSAASTWTSSHLLTSQAWTSTASSRSPSATLPLALASSLTAPSPTEKLPPPCPWLN